MGGPCPLGDSWAYDRSEGKWTRLEDCSSPINDGALISVSTTTHTMMRILPSQQQRYFVGAGNNRVMVTC